MNSKNVSHVVIVIVVSILIVFYISLLVLPFFGSFQ